jgi:hypothetical protein
MCEDAVEGDASFFVGVEPLVEEVAQEASVLRNAFALDARRGSDGGVLGVGREVADGSESAAGGDGIGDDVDLSIDFAGLKPPFRCMWRALGMSFPSTVCANSHSARAMTVRSASRESRTMSVLR